jgi:hypothetical protein
MTSRANTREARAVNGQNDSAFAFWERAHRLIFHFQLGRFSILPGPASRSRS